MDSLRQERSGVARVWQMLLDLHQVLGEKREFDARALEYALRFHRPAPVWRGGDAPREDSAMLRTGGGAYVSLTGKLSAESAPQLETILAIADKNRMLRIDFSKLQGADGPGCKGLLDLLQTMRRRGAEAMFTGESVLLGALANATRPGARGVDRSLWLLRLEILQWQGRRKEFDQVALDYASTCEVSPPVYETPAKQESVPPASADASDGALKVPKQLIESDEEFLGKIERAAGTRARVVLDCAQTDRLDFATAGKLLNLATNLALHGKQLELRHPNALVAALLDVAGVSAHADVVARK
jgi:anti-anti-sigma regulatory factor